MSRFSPALADTLIAAGWSEGRNAAELVAGWKKSQAVFAMSASVEGVLSEFGGIRGEHPAIAGASEVGYREGRPKQGFIIDPDVCTIDKAVFQALSQAAGESGVFPLGSMCAGNVSLVIGDSGAVYAFGAIPNCCLGKNIDEALNRIAVGEPGIALS